MGLKSWLLGQPENTRYSDNEVQQIVSRSIAETLRVAQLQGMNTGPYGTNVTRTNSMALSAVWACRKLLSESFAGLPFHIYQNNDGQKITVKNNLTKLFNTMPTIGMTSFTWRALGMSNLLLDGDFVAFIERDRFFEPTELRPILNKWELKDAQGEVYYQFELDGEKYLEPARNMFHVKVNSDNGLIGKGVIQAHRESLGIAMAAQKASKDFYDKGAKLDGILSTDQVLKPETYKNIKESWASRKEDRVPLLDGGIKYHAMSLNPQDAQYIETRKFEDLDIARMFGVPPHMIGIMDRATWSNVEAVGIEFSKYTMLPYATNWEQEINAKLLTEKQISQGYYSRFSLDGLMRADIKTRYESYKTAINSGFKSINEVRALEEDNPIEGGDKHFVQGNNLVDINDINGLNDNKNEGE